MSEDITMDRLRELFPGKPESFYLRNANCGSVFRPVPPVRVPAPEEFKKTPLHGSKPRLRQKQGDGMNKTERAFLAYLKSQFPNAEHYSQTFSLRLANGSNYRPDFISKWCVSPAGECGSEVIRMSAWETKGFKREASAVRIKVAATLFPWIKFTLVTRKKGQWQMQEILP